MKRPLKRLGILVPVTILVAVIAGLLANALNLDREWVYALGGAALALLASLGALWVVGFRFDQAFERSDGMHFHEAAVGASHDKGPVPTAERMPVPGLVHRGEKGEVIGSEPIRVPARRAVPGSTLVNEKREKLAIAQHEPILGANGSS